MTTPPAADALAAPATINDICEACNGCGWDNPAIATSPCRICGGSGQRSLKRCPFCGGRAEQVTGPMFHGAPRSAQVYMRYVMCLDCNNSTAMTDTAQQAAALWNARAALTRDQGEVAAQEIRDTIWCLLGYMGEANDGLGDDHQKIATCRHARALYARLAKSPAEGEVAALREEVARLKRELASAQWATSTEPYPCLAQIEPPEGK